MSRLLVIQEQVQLRVEDIATAHGNWPCRKGCDECCRRLASAPRVSLDEWEALVQALNALPSDVAKAARERIRRSESATRPVICPLLDTQSGACLVYEARPIACREYGFYVERQDVLGCSRIQDVSQQSPHIVWGNHASLEQRVDSLGPTAQLAEWMAR